MTENARPVDGLRVAIEMERRGHNLYERAQQFTDEPDLLALLKMLAADEAKHYTQFTAMLDVFDLPAMSAEECVLAAAKAADFFFPGGLMQVAMAGALTSGEALLEEALQSERDSIAFYGQLLSHVSDLDQQEIILRIIREEMTHLRTLTDRQKQNDRSEGDA